MPPGWPPGVIVPTTSPSTSTAWKDFDTIQQVNAVLKAAGFVLNTVGGEVKGDPR